MQRSNVLSRNENNYLRINDSGEYHMDNKNASISNTSGVDSKRHSGMSNSYHKNNS